MANPCFIIVNYPDYASYPLLTVYIENKLDVQMLILPVWNIKLLDVMILHLSNTHSLRMEGIQKIYCAFW